MKCMYIGNSNLSRYVQNMYFGAALHCWKKYNIVHVPETTTYKWKRYSATAVNVYKYWYEFDWDASATTLTYSYDKLLYLIGTTDINSPKLESEIQWYQATVSIIAGYYAGYLLLENKTLPATAYVYNGSYYTSSDSLTFYLQVNPRNLQSELDHVDYTQGVFIDEVTSQTPDQYPSNGYQSGYWYIYEGATTTDAYDIQGSYLTDVFSINDSAYPENGVQDSYWYTKATAQENMPIPITKGYIGVDQFTWDKYNAQWVNAVTTYTWKKYQPVISELTEETRVNNAATFDLKYRIDLTNSSYYTRGGEQNPNIIKPEIQNGKYYLSESNGHNAYYLTSGSDITVTSADNRWIFPVGGTGDVYSNTIYLISSDGGLYDGGIGYNTEPHGDYIYLIFSNPEIPESQAKYGTVTKYTIQSSAGEFIDTIQSTDQSAYPLNGLHTDGYWYVYDKSTTVDGHYVKLDLVETVTAANEQTYPVDGVQNNYWYVYAGNHPVAKQFWPFTLFTWKQYQSVYHPAVTTYTWNKYNISYAEVAGEIIKTPGLLMRGVYRLYICNKSNLSISNGRYTLSYATQTNDFSTGSADEIRAWMQESQVCAISRTSSYVWKGVTGTGGVELNYWAENGQRVGTGLQSWNGYRGSLQKYTVQRVQGSFVGTVKASNPSTYPNNGIHTDGYWYVYQSSNTEHEYYTQGDYIKDIKSLSQDAYPDNGRHTDGYWYVKQ